MATVIRDTTDCLDVQNANLSGSKFIDVNLSTAMLENVNLSGVRVRDANLTGLSIVDARLDGMTIDGVVVSDMIKFWHANQKGAGDAQA
jgi:uncharacterized protein YjbI with pentapeptide repeats